MKIVYYFDEKLNCCPVKQYLKQYIVNNNDSVTKITRKEKILTDIDSKIKYVRENNGQPIPPISKPLHGYSFFEIKNRKNKNIVIRVLYFRHGDKIVLLNAFEKLDNYKTDREKKRIDKHYKLTDEYYNKFKLNPNNYENYQ